LASIVAAASTCNPVKEAFSLVPLNGHPLPGLKRLADAFIVLGFNGESEPLKMPAPGTFRTTTIDDEIKAGTDAVAQTGTKAAPNASPPLPEIAPAARRRPAEIAAETAFALPELQGLGHFGDDDEPIYPEMPVPRNAYEDGDGPPIQLPP
jgi:hypothetical protein